MRVRFKGAGDEEREGVEERVWAGGAGSAVCAACVQVLGKKYEAKNKMNDEQRGERRGKKVLQRKLTVEIDREDPIPTTAIGASLLL